MMVLKKQTIFIQCPSALLVQVCSIAFWGTSVCGVSWLDHVSSQPYIVL